MKKFKNFLNMFNIFDPNLSSRSYKSPLIRIFVSLFIAFVASTLRLSVTIPNAAVNITLSLLCLLIVSLCILCFFVASVECLQVGDNRKKDKERQNMEK